MARYICGDQERRAKLSRFNNDKPSEALNGIDFLEVVDDGAEDQPLRQLLLAVRLFQPVPNDLAKENVRIEGGVRITSVHVQWARSYKSLVEGYEKKYLAKYFPDNLCDEKLLVIRTDSSGDFSIYRLRLIDTPKEPQDLRPRKDFDPRLCEVEFSFKVECPNEFDCKPVVVCPPEAMEEPEIDYLAKDYGSFRRLMLDRMRAIAPDWRERSPADLGVALVELMAYVGDQLSYFQDAVATEAYLGTARKRISVRRHARLVNYFLHEGKNARAWVSFRLKLSGKKDQPNVLELPKTTPVLTRWSVDGSVIDPEPDAAQTAGAVIFETLEDVTLHEFHNDLFFYTWSDHECCLPPGATSATLVKPDADLKKHQLLLFEEVRGPRTDAEADADPRHRHVVRLTRAENGQDPLTSQEIVEIEWDAADALPFPLCISAVTDDEHGARLIENVSVAHGNVVPADHGYTMKEKEDLGTALEDPPFRPLLKQAPLTHFVELPEGFANQPAAILKSGRPNEAKPAIDLTDSTGGHWAPLWDLLASGKFGPSFVAEVEEDGHARLRFGDGENGMAPTPGMSFTAIYRVGNGKAGNVGAEALCQVAFDKVQGKVIDTVRNPLPAWGGVEPESLEEARQYAPQAFRIQQRAVTEADYAEVAQRHPEVQRAAATFRWTGSWYTVFLTIDRKGGGKVDADFEVELRKHMERFRMAGYDLEVDGPRFVPLYLEMFVCVKPDHFRSYVKGALLERFSNRVLPDGRRGFFHPDEWTFGQPVYLSQIYAAASEVEGVQSVTVNHLQRRNGPKSDQAIEDGVLPIGRLEIALLDNDPNFQENGKLEIFMGDDK